MQATALSEDSDVNGHHQLKVKAENKNEVLLIMGACMK